ncbi:hypothetical protein EZS27_000078 [termite gut metagenome]|uniref:Glycosyl hydrolase family 95 N-terminal domain-containing protein n=1 Tax=termite gut metagenome TaxID=433724 RepID=A0A5J4T2A8_9ZZZZ
MRKRFLVVLSVFLVVVVSCAAEKKNKIDRHALVERNNPHVRAFEKLSSLSVGNGNFAYTVDATGLQTFPELYAAGVPLGTQSQWGWHNFPNPKGYKHEETLKSYNFRGWEEPYSVQFNTPGRQKDAANWYRANPHRLHLGNIGLELTNDDGISIKTDDIKAVNQELDLWNGLVMSRFVIGEDSAFVKTVCHPSKDQIAVDIHSLLITKGVMKINFRFSYPTGQHTDDACDRTVPQKHKTEIIKQDVRSLVFKRTLDNTIYYVTVRWTGKVSVSEKEPHYFVLAPESDDFTFTSEFAEESPSKTQGNVKEAFAESSEHWQSFWKRGGAVDFSKCTDERAKELERRVVLSHYLMAIQSAGVYPPQETGLTYNSWFGKYHLEMHWWHAVHFALWKRTDLLERSMDWYIKVYPVAKAIAERQKFKGIRWMKMTDPSGMEAPSEVGSFLAWQQPHFIYIAELIYRNNPSEKILKKYGFLVEETAEFMASFATYEELEDRYVLKGLIPAQETLNASETINPPFELSYWHYAMSVAQRWREREGKPRKPQWDELIDKLSPLAYNRDGLYLAAESAVDTYKDSRYTSDHMAVLGAVGVLPMSKLVREDYMKNTLHWVSDNWSWDRTWGWDYPMTAMNAARMNEPDRAIDALLMNKRTNTYLVNGHNYQDSRLRVYLPGNGGLLAAVAMMCAGWDGNKTDTPGFPKDGKWNVMWEDLAPMP